MPSIRIHNDARPVFPDLELSIARCRVLLSAVAIVAVYVDPTHPTLTRWLPLRGGPFTIDPYALAVMATHLAYSFGLYYALEGTLTDTRRLVAIATWGDVLFGALIALVTEGATSPFYAFFAFAVVAVGLRAGLGSTLVVTSVSAVLYLSLIAVSAPHNANFYIMRPVYLAITGYLVGYLGQQRLNLEQKVRELENTAQRERIARSLHDGYSQALAGVNLRLEACRKLLDRQRTDEAFRELTDLQASVRREHDELRGYIRSLIDLDASAQTTRLADETHFAVTADFGGPTRWVEHVLQIMLEGVRNVGRHAEAKHAHVVARAVAGRMQITIEDDGVGFPDDARVPWSIASRAAELDGNVELVRRASAGAHLVVELRQA
jgi:signal transduction histidine kinase